MATQSKVGLHKEQQMFTTPPEPQCTYNVPGTENRRRYVPKARLWLFKAAAPCYRVAREGPLFTELSM